MARAGVVCLGFFLTWSLAPSGVAEAAVVGSRHDFSSLSMADQGACAPCHLPHKAPAGNKIMWGSDMSQETTLFNQVGSPEPSTDPNYVPGMTIYCYDCHVDSLSATPLPDALPGGWSLGLQPQNIAFQDEVPPKEASDDPCVTSWVGYYEAKNGTRLDGTCDTPPAPGTATGGHYWQSEPTGDTRKQGDKIPCGLCHDPHNNGTSGNQVFLRASVTAGGLPITIGSGLTASANTRNGSGTGRPMCLACHKSGVTIYDVAPPLPPTYVPQHGGGDNTPCTNIDCHPHNFPDKPTTLGCSACHGNATNMTYWPDGAAAPDRLGEHDVHISRLATRLGYVGPTYSDVQQKTMCAYCHEHPTGANFEVAGVGVLHKNGARNVTGYVDFLWTTIGPAEATDTDATYVAAGSTCANFDCHNQQTTPASYGWYAGAASSCTMCHAVGGSGLAQPTDGVHGNTPAPKISGVGHDESFGAGGATASCTTCHTYLPAFSATSTHMANGTTPVDSGINTTADFYVFTAYTDATAACSGAPVNVNCHAGTGDAGTWARVWSTTAYNSDGTECANCHGGLNESDWTFGRGAHSIVDGNVEHNYLWDNDATSAEVVGNHTDDIGPASRCNLCHIYQFTGYTTNAGASIGWVGNPANTSTYHGDGSIAMNSNSTVRYNSTSYGCDLQSCHDTGTTAVSHHLEKSRWNLNYLAGPQGACFGCHGSSVNQTYWPDGAATPDRIGEHDVHISRLAAKLGFGVGPTYDANNQKTMCAYCHPNPAGATFSAIHNNGVRNVTGYVDYLWSTIGAAEATDTDAALVTADMTCANFDCHNRQATPAAYGWYAAGTTSCTMCHAVGAVGRIADPVDGLHDNTPLPRISGVAHDESFPTGGTCTTCHVYMPAMTATSTHMGNGTTPVDSGVNTTADFYVFTAYTDSSAGCSGAPVNVNCHDGAGDAGTWARVWSTTAYSSDGTECANCHGGINESDWTFGNGAHNIVDGNVEHNYSWDTDASSEVIGNHSADTNQYDRCTLCHVYQFTGYTTNAGASIGWVSNAANLSTYHGDGSIEMNSNSTVRYNSTNYGCDSGACHGSGATNYKLEKSRWAIGLLTGPSASCTICHGNSSNVTFWPDGAATPDRIGEHDVHISRLAAKLGFGVGPTYDANNQKTMCAYCHPNPTGATFSAVHNDGVRNVTGYVDYLWSTIGAAEATDADAALVTADMTCANFDCHNRQATPAAYGWYAAGTTTCTMCHAVGAVGRIADPVDGLHDNTPLPRISGVAHDESFPTGGTCTACHVYMPAMTATSTHMGNGTTPVDSGVNTTADFYVFTAYTDSSAACSGAPVNVNCHDGAGDAGTWARLWSTTAYNSNGTECANCHGGINESDWTFGNGAHNIVDGNVEHNYSWDTDASSEVIGNHSADTGQFDRCELCHVYQFTSYNTNGNASIGWLGNGANNSTYHGDGSIEMNSQSLVRYNSTNYGCDSGACHGNGATNYKLEKSRWAVNPLLGPGPNCALCHGTSTGTITFWPDGAATPDRVGEHAVHVSRLAAELDFGAGPSYTEAQQLTMCAYCHPNPTGSVFGSTHINGARNVTGYVDPLWTTIGAAETTDADAAYVAAGSTCANFDCHNRQATPAAYGWYAGGTTACTMCHTVGGSGIAQPTDGLHDNAPLPRISGIAHDESFATGGTCTTCHVSVPAVSSTSTHMADGTMPADTNGNAAADYYLFGAYSDANGSCIGAEVGGAGCHDGPGESNSGVDSWARLWSTTAYNSDGTECANCHGGLNASDWTFGGVSDSGDGNVQHNYSWDTDASSEVIGNHTANTNQSDKCDLCHVYQYTGYTSNGVGSIGWVGNAANSSTYHGDNSIEMNSHSTVRYNTADYGCDSGTCHGTGGASNYHLEDSRWAVNLLAGPAAGCDLCHGNSANATYWPDGAASPDRVGEHVIHIARLATKLGYGAGPAYTDAQQKTMCSYCHQNPAEGNFAGNHKDGIRTVTGFVDPIWSAITPGVEETDTDATYTAAGGTCANFDCHNDNTTPAAYAWYAGGASACTMCHVAGGSGLADPVDGLHDNSPLPSVSAVAHDESFPTGGTCTTCHVYMPAFTAASTHMGNGTTPADGAGNTTADFYVFTAYTDSSAACSGAPVNANCHDGAGDAGSWARLWSTTAYSSDGTECANCHGGINTSDWTFGNGGHNIADGNVEHNYSWDTDAASEVIGNHSGDIGQRDRCDLCHVYNYGAYLTNGSGRIGWVGNGANNSTYHGNGSIEMNSHSTVRYSSTNYGCDGGVCHGTGTSNYHLEKSRWAVNLLAGPWATCSMCHGNTANTTYWPDESVSPDRAGRHLIHVSRIAAKLNYGGGPSYTDAQQKNMCAYCHENPTGANFGTLHKNGDHDVTGYFDGLWTSISGDVASDADATYTEAAGTCQDVNCHNRKDTEASYSWYATGTSACMMCHTPGGGASYLTDPLDGLHPNAAAPTISGVSHDDSFPTGGTCTTCHVSVPAVSNVSTHMTNGTSPADDDANTTADFYLFTGYSDANASCSGSMVNANCHDGPGETGSWARRWADTAYNNDGTECANCHGGINGSDWTFGAGGHTTTDGNVEHNYSWDTDSSSEVIGKHNDDTDQYDRCNLCHVFQYTGYTTNGGGSIGWAGNASNTSTYHGNDSIEMNSHSTVRYNSTNYGCDGGVCHGTGGASNYHLEKSRWAVNPIVGPPATCEGCHDGSIALAPNVMDYWDGSWWDSNMGGVSTTAGQQGGHGDPDNQAGVLCTQCHDVSTPANTHKDGVLNSVEQRLNLNANTAHLQPFFFGTEMQTWSVQVNFDSGCYNQCHAAISGILKDMRHAKDTDPAEYAVLFGTHITKSDGESVGIPVDSDLTTRCSTGQPDFAPCISCHNPHGTGNTNHKGPAATNSNYMIRSEMGGGDWWNNNTPFCSTCHGQ